MSSLIIPLYSDRSDGAKNFLSRGSKTSGVWVAAGSPNAVTVTESAQLTQGRRWVSGPQNPPLERHESFATRIQ